MGNNTTLLFERPSNVTSMADFLLQHQNNTYYSGSLGLIIMGVVFTITFGSLSGRGGQEAFGAASFVTFITASLLAVLGVVGVYGWAVAFVLLASAIVLNRGGR